jgi:hypothetical protein
MELPYKYINIISMLKTILIIDNLSELKKKYIVCFENKTNDDSEQNDVSPSKILKDYIVDQYNNFIDFNDLEITTTCNLQTTQDTNIICDGHLMSTKTSTEIFLLMGLAFDDVTINIRHKSCFPFLPPKNNKKSPSPKKHPYKRLHHFSDLLEKKESKNPMVPLSVTSRVREIFGDNVITSRSVKKALSKGRLNRYYENIGDIVDILGGNKITIENVDNASCYCCNKIINDAVKLNKCEEIKCCAKYCIDCCRKYYFVDKFECVICSHKSYFTDTKYFSNVPKIKKLFDDINGTLREIINEMYPNSKNFISFQYLIKMLNYYQDKIPTNEKYPFIRYNNDSEYVFYEACHRLGWITLVNHDSIMRPSLLF